MFTRNVQADWCSAMDHPSSRSLRIRVRSWLRWVSARSYLKERGLNEAAPKDLLFPVSFRQCFVWWS